MPKTKTLDGQAFPDAFQCALDEQDVVGRWEWDVTTGQVRVDGFIAPLFNVDAVQAETGIAAEAYVAAIHPDDRDRVRALAWRSAKERAPFLTEYRVTSVDGRTRWVLARGQFASDHAGNLTSGRGILVHVDRLRLEEGRFDGSEAQSEETPLDRAADHAIAAQQAIVELHDPALKVHADTLLMALGRKLAQQEVQDRRRGMN